MRQCFVPGCKSSVIKKPGEKHVALFRAPKDPVLRKQWHIASRRGDREMTERDCICELHFTEDCMERYFITDMGDGNLFKLERERIRLIKGSVPTIFSFSKSNPVPKRGRPKKLQNKENGRGDLVLKKKSSPAKFKRQLLVLSCLAYGCTNSSDKKIPGISFHRFPTNKTRRKIWTAAVGRKNWKPSNDSVLCSAHFAPDLIEKSNNTLFGKLKPGAVPTIFAFGEKQQMNRLPANLQTAFCDSSDSDRSESYLTEINDFSVQDSDDCEVPETETNDFAQEEDGENSEVSSAYEDMLSKYFVSENLIVKGHEEIFGKFVANELKILLCDPPLYTRTKEKIWQVLEEASQIRKK